tara:strand:+ start:447 stop:836 length:390 start_codon:yes stop_codon:yes gene_type:complete
MNMNNTTTPASDQDCAQTPWWFIESVEYFTSLKIQLDVCASSSTAKSNFYFSLEENDNGLLDDWSHLNANWCNPPYSDIKPWVEKVSDESKLGCTTLMLIPDKPEVGYTRLARQHADTVIHMPFRLNFL